MKTSKTYKAAIIGCGGISVMHADALTALGVTVTAVCDIKPERAEQKAATLKCAVYTDYKAMLADGGFDAAHICLPHYLHAEAAILAATHKLHVLTEKPMATNVADAQRMIAAAETNGVTLGVIFQNRYNPGSLLVKETMASGALGTVLSGRLRVQWHRDGAYYTESGWRGRWDTEGGGALINQSIHTVDLANWLIDSEPVFVDAAIHNRMHPMIEVEDAAEGIIGYANGAIISFCVNTYNGWDAPVELELRCEHGLVTITGDEAVIRFDDGREMRAAQNPNDVFQYGGGKNYWGVSHIKQIKNFYESLDAGVQPTINGAAALVTQRLVNGVYDSGKTKKRVML